MRMYDLNKRSLDLKSDYAPGTRLCNFILLYRGSGFHDLPNVIAFELSQSPKPVINLTSGPSSLVCTQYLPKKSLFLILCGYLADKYLHEVEKWSLLGE